ncbi:aldo/keto reductase, partial [Xanthomonas axonopodis]
DQVILSTKTGLRLGDGPNDAGASRFRLLRAVEASLRRLRTDYIDLLQLHAFDAMTPMEETLSTLDGLVRAGKVRYLGASNYAGWQLMKSQAVADAHGWSRFVANQTYYSLAGRDYEWQLMPQHSRLHATAAAGPAIDDARLFDIVDALDAVAAETGRSVPQIAINWLLQRPTVSTVLIGARDEAQLRENLGAMGWSLTDDQRARLDQASAVEPPYPYYPYWRGQFAERSPLPL